MEAHELVIEPSADQTLARCTCGHWTREADPTIVAVTGRSREDALRAAHELHTRDIGPPSGLTAA